MDAMTRGAAQALLSPLTRAERRLADAYLDANRGIFRKYLEGVPEDEAAAYTAARAKAHALSWTRNAADPVQVKAQAEADAATERIAALKRELEAVR